MIKVVINLPRVAASALLVNKYIEKYQDVFSGQNDVVVIINGHDCEITTIFFVDYFRTELKRFEAIKHVVIQQGPPSLLQIGESKAYTGLDFRVMVDTIEKNVVKVVESEGVYVHVAHEIKDIELFAIALLERGFKLETSETD